MIHYKIDDDTKASLSTSLGELDEISQRTVAGIDSVIIGNVVAIVATRRRLEGKQPDCCYPEALQVIEAAEKALENRRCHRRWYRGKFRPTGNRRLHFCTRGR